MGRADDIGTRARKGGGTTSPHVAHHPAPAPWNKGAGDGPTAGAEEGRVHAPPCRVRVDPGGIGTHRAVVAVVR
ncbi:hypothetical protein Shyhy01_63170 [Streptomyces hygroscopicus subsp. hygroscopicus]|nr:hypothetical protein Shyhy01_63170 [Streptomyces hygroscopicus subsp. hygroscopicus]